MDKSTASSNYTPYYDVLGTGLDQLDQLPRREGSGGQQPGVVVDRSRPAGFGRGRPDDQRRRCRSDRRDVGGAGGLDRPDRRRGAPAASNQTSGGGTTSSGTVSTSSSTTGSSSSSSSTGSLASDTDATDAAVTDFDLADLYASPAGARRRRLRVWPCRLPGPLRASCRSGLPNEGMPSRSHWSITFRSSSPIGPGEMLRSRIMKP